MIRHVYYSLITIDDRCDYQASCVFTWDGKYETHWNQFQKKKKYHAATRRPSKLLRQTRFNNEYRYARHEQVTSQYEPRKSKYFVCQLTSCLSSLHAKKNFHNCFKCCEAKCAKIHNLWVSKHGKYEQRTWSDKWRCIIQRECHYRLSGPCLSIRRSILVLENQTLFFGSEIKIISSWFQEQVKIS